MSTSETRRVIENIIRQYLPDNQYRAVIFGSRANNTNRRWSDVDIGILGKKRVPLGIFSHIQEELINSTIPYRVDVVDLIRVSEQFRTVALQDARPL